ncbi:MAG: hypothetical protein KGZ84_07865 [Erysipelotrichia bacterium]|nr:hypothetical protein [Erysipelotrichia bacterium]
METNAKRDYLIKTFSRTKKKDYENYILNAIWTKLNRLDLQPITQKYVRYKNGRYGLIDLYFPQINFGIECDEYHHINRQSEDNLRTMTLFEILDAVDESHTFVLKRIKAYESIESIHSQIDEVVNEIKAILRSKEDFQPWDIKERVDEIATIQSISVDDDVRFRKISDIANALGKRVKGMQSAYFPLKDNVYVWCPQLAATYNERIVSAGKHGWINQLSEDWNYIIESREDNRKMSTLEKQKRHIRITFAKSKDHLGNLSFRFVGVYEFDEMQSNEIARVYKRISISYST